MGTCDELALDVLLNLLVGYSRDLCGIDHIFVGGENEEWRVPEEEEDNGPEVRTSGIIDLWQGGHAHVLVHRAHASATGNSTHRTWLLNMC